MAKDVNGAATPAIADGQGEGQPKAPKKDNTEQVRLDRGEAARGRHLQRDTTMMASCFFLSHVVHSFAAQMFRLPGVLVEWPFAACAIAYAT